MDTNARFGTLLPAEHDGGAQGSRLSADRRGLDGRDMIATVKTRVRGLCDTELIFGVAYRPVQYRDHLDNLFFGYG